MALLNCNANVESLKGYRIEIYPTEDQKKLIQDTINIYRGCYNIALGIQNKRFLDFGLKYIEYYDMCKIFSELRKLKGYEWMNNIPLSTIREALRSLNNGFKRCFRNVAKYPKYKSKRYSKKSFTVRSERTRIRGRNIYISGIGTVDAKNHHIPDNSRVYHPTVTFDGYRYWFSCQVEENMTVELDIEKSEVLGIDVGIRNLATLSNGKTYHFPKSIDKYEKRLKRQQRRLSRDYENYLKYSNSTKTKYEDIPKSKNHLKRLKQQRKTYNKIRNIRHTFLHTMTKEIVNLNPTAIVIETISVRNIIKTEPWMRKYAPQMCFSEIHRQISYKANLRNIPVIRAEDNFPSTRTCSNCGYIVSKNKSIRHIFNCPVCGYKEDRDLNAAYNLRNLAYQQGIY